MQEKKVTKILKVKKVSIVGVIPSFAFQRAKYCALELHKRLPQRFPPPEIIGLLELDWNEKLMEWRQTLGREYWCLRRPVAVFFDGRFLGSDIELIKLTTNGNIFLENVPRKNMAFMKEHFKNDYISHLKKTKRIYCYLDICVDDIYVGTLTFQLYSDLLPRTCENFKSLCVGSRGPLLSYRGSRIHRIVKKGWLQGGDIQYKTGGGGYSIFCDPLEDECFGISHDRRGILSMASSGRHENGSQFFLTLIASKWMDTKFVAFGRLVEGSRVLKLIEDVETFYECPLQKIEIKSCGKLDLEDVEDVDAKYREEPMPRKKPKIIEKVSDQVIRLIMEALTEALKKREQTPDILDDGDVPSKMNLQLYFQGFYSIPQEIVEDSAQYLRNLRREMYRMLKPSATEVVEVLMYDLLVAVLTKMTTLDDIRETVGHDLYQKMIGGINMEMELCQKPYVKRLVDQIISTAQTMIGLISKKLMKLNLMSREVEFFREKMDGWVKSFVLQETFKGDNYHISDRLPWKVAKKQKEEEKEKPKREGKPCCDLEKKPKEDVDKLMGKYPPEEICCMGSKLLEMGEVDPSDYFKSCYYDLKKVTKPDEERMPILDLIEISRFKLRWLRKGENEVKSKERIAVEKKVRKWMEEVVYTPETSWIKDLLFGRDEIVYDHVEEILYGAMTAALLEMYYFYERYLKLCAEKKKKLITRMYYPENSDHDGDSDSSVDVHMEEVEETVVEHKEEEVVKAGRFSEEEPKTQKSRPPCTCGHPCCVCEYAPNATTPTESLAGEEGEEEEEGEVKEGEGGEGDEKTEEGSEEKEGGKKYGEDDEGGGEIVRKKSPAHTKEERPGSEVNPCGSDMELVDLNALLAEKAAMKPEEINMKSFGWLKAYILEKGCDLKTEFARQTHKWLDGERFNYKGFISKHSMVTKASLLSLSVSLAELITEENHMKKEIKDFVYDLWDLYFNEMFREAILEKSPEEMEKEKTSAKERADEEGEKEKAEKEMEEKKEPDDYDECKKIMAQTPEFDFSKFCERFKQNVDLEEEESNADEDAKRRKDEIPVAETAISQVGPELSETVEETHKSKAEIIAEDQDEAKPAEDPDAVEKSEKRIGEEEAREAEAEAKADVEAVGKKEKVKKKKKTPIIIQELVDVISEGEVRQMPPYVLPFWVKFLTQLTKQALGTMAKISRLPRRLYFLPDADVDFDNKMKEWFEFNAFNPEPTKGREIMDYIALHHKSLTNLEDTARSYLRKKKYSELLNRCTRIASSEVVAEEIVADVIGAAMTNKEGQETLEAYISNIISSAITSAGENQEENLFETDRNESDDVEGDE